MSLDLHSFVTSTRWTDLPPAVQEMARRCLLDLIGTAAAGRQTELSRIISIHATRMFGASDPAFAARILFDGRRASLAGAALAGGMTIDSFDAHDGHVLTKGHAGVAILPALLAMADRAEAAMSGPDFLTSLVIGYEVAIRAGIAQHRTCCDYHTSGAWNALGAVAVAARALGLDAAGLAEALGIAEYHGPRSQMMRCIDFPTMVKDGSGWGAMTGVDAAYLAAEGFTGAPALVCDAPEVADLWADLGQGWRILELYFKPYPVCRWAQPAVEAGLSLIRAHHPDPAAIETIEVETFDAAVRLDQACPTTTEQAQYSLPFPLAVATVHGTLPPGAITAEGLRDPVVQEMSTRVRLRTAPEIEAKFPAQRFARVTYVLRDGTRYTSDTMPARGDAESPLSDAEILAKFCDLTESLSDDRRAAIRREVAALADRPDVGALLELVLTNPADARQRS
ncbi:MmgE/PrpD family protein [Sinirhodobacter populi]|uniref:MmgE/PrpD family protein n=1 Tax=Paenirhodobacter populi TaxID=2306993 RepID=A0A443K3H5_9RHOB|nr:MmgE/PrpD family protein [Sinirhodobacter populi]RWR27300.1 MmgE/PrpD family protein [Sinirhodobacter populi]